MAESKEPVCPKCGSQGVIPIIHGLPTPETQRKAEEGKV